MDLDVRGQQGLDLFTGGSVFMEYFNRKWQSKQMQSFCIHWQNNIRVCRSLSNIVIAFEINRQMSCSEHTSLITHDRTMSMERDVWGQLECHYSLNFKSGGFRKIENNNLYFKLGGFVLSSCKIDSPFHDLLKHCLDVELLNVITHEIKHYNHYIKWNQHTMTTAV